MSETKSQSNILRVYCYEPGTKTSKQKRTLDLLEANKPDEIKLEIIRRLLVQQKVLGSLDARSPFCDANGAEVSDMMDFSLYLRQLEESDADDGTDENEDNKKKEVETEEAKKKGGRDEEAAALNSPNTGSGMIGKSFKVFYKKRRAQTKSNDANKEFVKKQLDLRLKKTPELKHLRAELLKSAFKDDKWQAVSSDKLFVASELNERDWSVIIRTNCLLSGQRLVVEDKTDAVSKKTVRNHLVEQRTPFSAFKIKQRFFSSYEIAAPAANDAPSKGAPTNDELGSLPAHIPRFRVDDSSYMTVIETKNTLESSMAKGGFNLTSVKASAGGGLWGVSAAAKGGFSLKHGKEEVTATDEEHRRIHVTYSFPRVSIFLDASSLELTQSVMTDIELVQTKEDVIAFGEKYGHIFSRRVKIGGRLTSTHQIDSEASGKSEERENALKIAAAASFSGPSVSGSAEGSHETGDKSADTAKKQDFKSNMTWEATGGDTTLCNDPPRWCGTLGNFRNWRVVEQGDIIPLAKLISTFKGFEGTEAQFRKAAGIAEDGVATGQQIRTRIQLINAVTKEPLVMIPSPNTLDTALKHISTAAGGISPSLSTTKEEIFRKVSGGCVTYGSKDKSYSTWLLERWVEKGQSPRHPYGAKTFIYNDEMPEDAKFVGLTNSILHTDGSGFLCPTSSSQKAWFTLHTPPGKPPKTGPLKTDDIVELRVRDSGDSTDLGVLMNSKYHEGPGEIQNLINNVPAFAPRNAAAKDPGMQIDRGLDDVPGRFLQFKIVVHEWF